MYINLRLPKQDLLKWVLTVSYSYRRMFVPNYEWNMLLICSG